MKNLFLTIITFAFALSIQAQSVEYCIRNVHTVTINGNQQATEFDIFILANQSNKKLGDGVVYIDYNPQYFGSSVAKNSLIIIRDGISAILGDKIPVINSYRYSENGLVENNNSASRFAISWELELTSQAHLISDTNSELLFRCQIPISSGTGTTNHNLQFYLTHMQNETFEHTNITPFTVEICIPMPVEGMELMATILNPQQVQLDWRTISEINNDYFVLEKQSGTGNFEEIAHLNAIGTSSQASYYQWIDKTPMAPKLMYRIKQVDVDGKYSYSNIVEVRMPDLTAPKVYPNPCASLLTLKLPFALRETISFEMYDLKGQLVLHKSWPSTSQQVQVDISKLACGLYPYRITSGNQSWSGRIAKVSR